MAVEAILLMIQGLFSFLADSWYLGTDSIWHMNDRILATLLTTVQFIRLFFTHKVPTALVSGFGASLLFAIHCFRKSKEARATNDCEGYFFWHGLWHLSIPLAGAAMIYSLCAVPMVV